jgi:hypothetical protein
MVCVPNKGLKLVKMMNAEKQPPANEDYDNIARMQQKQIKDGYCHHHYVC